MRSQTKKDGASTVYCVRPFGSIYNVYRAIVRFTRLTVLLLCATIRIVEKRRTLYGRMGK
nr:MAG TPA: hypothetical protein [Bacteriophage sp.]